MSEATPSADLGILLTLALRSFVDRLHNGLDDAGFEDVRPAFGVVFRALKDGPLTLTELAGQLGVSKQAAAKVVSEMEAKSLLFRAPSGSDGRAKELALTDRGRRAMATAVSIGGSIEASLRTAAGPETVSVMRHGLEVFVEQAGDSDDLARRRSRALW